MQNKLKLLDKLLNKSQLFSIKSFLVTDEKDFYIDKINEIYETIQNMSKTYETDGKGNNGIVYLHYFINGRNFYIIEKDI